MNAKLIVPLLCLFTAAPGFAATEQNQEQTPSAETSEQNLEQSQLTEAAVNPDASDKETNSPTMQRIDLSTATGFELGVQGSSYRYQEGTTQYNDFMHETGAKFGITGSATKAFQSGFFVTGDLRFAYSSNDYASASGKQLDISDYLGEVRLVMGKDFIASNLNFGFSPYIGIGYRNLFNDSRGISSLGAHGYQRDSQYIYLPVGLTHRFIISDNARISTNLEYDQLLYGQQESDLSDASRRLPNITNNQHGGYGLRGSLMYERASWAVGPFCNYWNINKSDVVTSGVLTGGNEPRNQTIEYGLQVRYRF